MSETKLLVSLALAGGLLSSTAAVAALDNPDLVLGINVQAAPFSDETEETEILGIDLDAGRFFKGGKRWAWVLNIGAQEQDVIDEKITRYVAGLSYYYFFNRGSSSNLKPFLGVKRTFYWGKGSTQEALDCLECSNVDESYEGGNFFATLGLRFSPHAVLKIDYRLGDERSEFSTNADDPFGVGPSYNYGYRDIPDPQFIISIGYWGLND